MLGRHGCRGAPPAGLPRGGAGRLVHPRIRAPADHAAGSYPHDPAARGHLAGDPAGAAPALASVRSHVTIRLGFSWLLPDPWAQQAVGQFEQATGATVSLVRSDDPLAAVEQAAIDVAVIRGRIPDGSPVRRIHLFDEVRVAMCSEHSRLASYQPPDWDEGTA